MHPAFRAFLMSHPRRRTCRYAAPNCSDVECATPGSTREDRTLPDGTVVLPVLHDLLATPPAMIEQAIRELLDVNPHWLYADPTHLAFLARHMARRGAQAPPSCAAIALTYSLGTAVARRQIAALFGEVCTAEVVSMSEFGWVAMECPNGRMHLNTRSYYAELLVGDRAARAGELAELVLTSRGDKLSPHIRYRTGDYYRLEAVPCPCGHAYPSVRHEGRWRDMLRRGPEVLLTPRALDALVGPAPWLDLYKLHQASAAHFVFRYVPAGDRAPGRESELADALHTVLGRDARIDVEATSYIAGERSGKFASYTSALESDGDRVS